MVNFGDWAAQWDELEAAWLVIKAGGETVGRYYYNYRTGESTWNKPDALQVATFI